MRPHRWACFWSDGLWDFQLLLLICSYECVLQCYYDVYVFRSLFRYFWIFPVQNFEIPTNVALCIFILGLLEYLLPAPQSILPKILVVESLCVFVFRLEGAALVFVAANCTTILTIR